MAKRQYWAYTSALSSLSQAASTAVYGNEYEQATKSAASAYSSASAQVSRSGTSATNRGTNGAQSIASEASTTISSVAAAASNQAVRTFDENRDYVYSGYNSTNYITLF
jgi:hypothetical protein